MTDEAVGEVFVLAVNYTAGLAMTDDGVIGRIDTYLDFEGDETDEMDLARVAIVEWPDETWTPLDMSEFQERRLS